MGNLLTPHCKINKPNSNFFTFVKIKEVSFFLGQHNFSCVPWITHSIPLFWQNPLYILYHLSFPLFRIIASQHKLDLESLLVKYHFFEYFASPGIILFSFFLLYPNLCNECQVPYALPHFPLLQSTLGWNLSTWLYRNCSCQGHHWIHSLSFLIF